MLLFSTMLNIVDTMTKDDFIRLVLEWNQTSTHAENIIQGIEWNGEYTVKYSTDTLSLSINEYRDHNIIAVRFEKHEQNGTLWCTDYVMNFNERKMSILLNRSYKEEALKIDSEFSTPHFITLLIKKKYLKPDGNLPVSRDPIEVTEENLHILSDIVNRGSTYRLPVIYVSKTSDNKSPVDVAILAGRLKGVAHILVQSSTKLDSTIRAACHDKNEYKGGIGIYFPGETMPHIRYSPKSGKTRETNLFEKILTKILQYNNTQFIEELYTYQGVLNGILAVQLQSQIKKREEADDLVLSTDDEIKDLKEKVYNLAREYRSLLTENNALRNKLNKEDQLPILVLGKEKDLFDGEIKDILLSFLEEYKNDLDPSTRRYHVINDILEENGGAPSSVKGKEKTLKTLFKSYKNISKTMRQSLADLGFEIIENGKHCKLVYYGDERYTFTIAKTPSDNRTGKNTAAMIIKGIL